MPEKGLKASAGTQLSLKNRLYHALHYSSTCKKNLRAWEKNLRPIDFSRSEALVRKMLYLLKFIYERRKGGPFSSSFLGSSLMMISKFHAK